MNLFRWMKLNSIQSKLCVIIIFVTTAILTAYSLIYIYTVRSSKINARLDYLGNMVSLKLSKILADPVHNMDVEYIREILKIEMMEENQKFQDAILNIHHASMLTFSQTPAFKIIENQLGVAFIKIAT